ncbi:MAG TPA: pitrilysin family protein [Planctomycetaceae bacterium]|nr:pitrilysin family protein [Planctomycetaceae bacterium]
MKFFQTKLDNGLQVIAELNASVHSVAMGFFVRTGSRDETPEISGVSHFLEHMVFKGSEKFSADDVNRVFDEIGAKYNAATAEEGTLFYGAILPEYLPTAFELFAHILRPAIRSEDFDMEKKVILEEIGMYDDQPSFLAYENLMKSHFAGHPLGQSVLGTNESITGLTCEQMRAYHRDHYLAGNIVLAVAGHTEWTKIVELAQQHCGHWPAGICSRSIDEARPRGGLKVITRPKSQQQHVMQMTSAPSAQNGLRYAAEILSVIVGDGSGSRLFWELVDPGLAEAADLDFAEHDGSGAYLTYLSCDPEATEENLAIIRGIYEELNRDGVHEGELEQAKNKVSSRVVLRSERPMGRLSSLGGNWVYRQEYRSVDDDLQTLRSITTDNVRELLAKYPLGMTTTVTVGPLESLKV